MIVRPGSAAASSPAVERHELDLTTPFTTADLPSGRVDAVVHLAQHRDYASFPEGAGSVASVTIAAACRLAEHACQRGATRFVFASSGGIYAPGPDPEPEDAGGRRFFAPSIVSRAAATIDAEATSSGGRFGT